MWTYLFVGISHISCYFFNFKLTYTVGSEIPIRCVTTPLSRPLIGKLWNIRGGVDDITLLTTCDKDHIASKPYKSTIMCSTDEVHIRALPALARGCGAVACHPAAVTSETKLSLIRCRASSLPEFSLADNFVIEITSEVDNSLWEFCTGQGTFDTYSETTREGSVGSIQPTASKTRRTSQRGLARNVPRHITSGDCYILIHMTTV
ncbi:hypothetical protein V1524DRAFT_286212 [Lipomyces starkeyi]